jgi:hypothetical protein
VCLVCLHRDDDAFGDLNRALELEPDPASALNGRWGSLFRRQPAQALRDFNAAITTKRRGLEVAVASRHGCFSTAGDSAWPYRFTARLA